MGITKIKTAFITGITGQDGYYLAELLLQKGYFVHGLIQPLANEDISEFECFKSTYGENKFHLHIGDLTDSGSLTKILAQVKPDEIYNLGAQSHVAKGFDAPEYTCNINALGTLRLLEVLVALDMVKHVKFYQASTSELFGNAPAPQTEKTPFQPLSPYATSKLFAHHIINNYRQAYGLQASCGILFNHESPRRGDDFVTQKICKAVININKGEQDFLELGNLNAVRDWGHAKDYVEGMWLMIQEDECQDYVLATGSGTTVREFCEMAFGYMGVSLNWLGEGEQEVGVDVKTGRELVKVNPKFYRPCEVEKLIGNAEKAREHLGWVPKYNLEQIVEDMMDYQLGYQASKIKKHG